MNYCSQKARAPRLHRGCHRFEPGRAHTIKTLVQKLFRRPADQRFLALGDRAGVVPVQLQNNLDYFDVISAFNRVMATVSLALFR